MPGLGLRGLLGLESDAVVPNCHQHAIVGLLQGDLDAAGVGVFTDVGHRLLSNTVNDDPGLGV